MHNTLTLLTLEFKNKFGIFSLKDKKSIWKLITTLLFSVVIFILIMLGGKILFSMFAKAGLEFEILVIFLTIAFIFLVITSISSTIKVLYYKGDNEILMRLPVTGNEVYWSKTIFLLVQQILITALIIVPFLLSYAKVVHITPVYYVSMPFVILFMVLIPFFLSNILAIPFMHLSNKIRHKFGLIIISLAILMTAIFFVYTLLFEKAIIYLQDGQNFSVFDEDTVTSIISFCNYLVPTKYFASMLLGETFVSSRIVNREVIYRTVGYTREFSFVIFIITLELCIIGSYIVIKNLYHKTLLKNVEIEGSAYRKKTKNRRKPIFFSLLHKEFIQIFRSVNYSFQYFVLACAMPVMVYSCNKIAIAIGMNDIGYKIIPGLTLLIMLIFNTVIISFSATSISREGNNFFHTKVMPVSIVTQLAVKFTLYHIVSFAANTITAVIIIFSKQMVSNPNGSLEIIKPLSLYLIVSIVSIAHTLRSMRFDIKKPRFNINGEGELVNSNTNTTNSIILGFIISLIFGFVGMILPYMFDSAGFSIMFYILLALALIYMVYSILVYSIGLKKTYNKIV